MTTAEYIANTIAEEWKNCGCEGDDLADFYDFLYAPDGWEADAVDQALTQFPTEEAEEMKMTKELALEVLKLLRKAFPKPSEDDDSEDEAKCCGCSKEVEDDDDYGNNADVADTCCKECWEKE